MLGFTSIGVRLDSIPLQPVRKNRSSRITGINTLCMSNEVIVAAASTSAIDCFPRTINNHRVQLFSFGELFIRNYLDAYRPVPAKEARRLFLVELLVTGGDVEEEAVVRDAQESPGVEERIIGAGQPVQCEHPGNRSEGRKKD